MSFTDVFIKRPVFASVISLIILLLGIASFYLLPLRQYPEIKSTVINVSTSYSGANSELVEGFISAPLENVLSSVNGVDYITSDNSSGHSKVSLHFKLGVDINDAFADVTSKVGQARSILPKDADDPVVTRKDPDAQPILYISFTSDQMGEAEITDYLQRSIVPEIGAIEGVGEVVIFGESPYAMRVWLDPARMVAHDVTATDLRDALVRNNLQAPGGKLKNEFQSLNVSVSADLKSPNEFNRLIVKQKDGQLVRVGSVGQAKLGAVEAAASIWVNDRRGQIIGVIPRSDGNPLEIAKNLRKRLKTAANQLPGDLQYDISFDSTKFISASIKEVRQTILEASVFVVIVVFLFLGSFRALLIPLVTIPLSLIGVCFLMWLMGFSLNTLTLLAFVLAIGMVVDDAIVVLENIYRYIEEGMKPIAAALKGAKEIQFAVISMTLTLAAVYAPIGFISGVTGALFREFAFTLAAAVIISGFVALTLSPMMCSRILSAELLKGRFTHFIDVQFERLSEAYKKLLEKVLYFRKWVVGVVFLVLAGCFFLYVSFPGELAPKEDMGLAVAPIKGPVGANLKHMEKYTSQLVPVFKSVPEIESYGIVNLASGEGMSFFMFKPWGKRKRSADEIIADLIPQFMQITGILAFPVNPYRLPGSSGRKPIKFVIKTTGSYRELSKVMEKLEEVASQNPGFVNVESELKFDTPEWDVKVDRAKAGTMGIPMVEIANTLNLALGQPRVGRFEMGGKAYDVIPQLEPTYANRPENLRQLYVRTIKDELVPLSNLVTVREKVVPPSLEHFQQLRAAFLTASLAKGYSMDEAVGFLVTEANKLMKDNMQYDFAGDTRQYISAKGEMLQVFTFAMIFIFLVLAAQFESFRDPFIVMLSVPLSILGALIALRLYGFFGSTDATMNIYSQIGLVTLVGLISKHGILMVEFANELQTQGKDKFNAILESATIRLRPILMTTAAMVLGAVPLAFASGAGAISRQHIGWVIVGGMSFGTFLTLFVVPAVYLLVASKKTPDDTVI